MLFSHDTTEFDKQIENRAKLEHLIARVESKTSSETVQVVKTILQAAWNDEELRVPTHEHPYLKENDHGDYRPVPLQDIPEDLEVALRMLLDDPEALRLLEAAFRMHFTTLICPYSGGIIVRGLLSVPGGE